MLEILPVKKPEEVTVGDILSMLGSTVLLQYKGSNIFSLDDLEDYTSVLHSVEIVPDGFILCIDILQKYTKEIVASTAVKLKDIRGLDIFVKGELLGTQQPIWVMLKEETTCDNEE